MVTFTPSISLTLEPRYAQTVREDILAHLKDQANVQEAHMRMRTKKSRLRMGKAWRKILSDVDDTMLCSGGHYPAGIDKR